MAEVQALRNGQYSIRVTGAELEEVKQTMQESMGSDDLDLSKLDAKTREAVERALRTRRAAKASIAEALKDVNPDQDGQN